MHSAVTALQLELRRAMAEDGYDAETVEYLESWLGAVEPPDWGNMPSGLLELGTLRGGRVV